MCDQFSLLVIFVRVCVTQMTQKGKDADAKHFLVDGQKETKQNFKKVNQQMRSLTLQVWLVVVVVEKVK